MPFNWLPWLDKAGQARLKDDLESYKAYPLERNEALEWKGPSLFPRSTAGAPSTSNERRPVIASLLRSDGPSDSSSVGWELTLVEPLKVDLSSEENNRNQIWRCRVRARVRDRRQYVVVKLYYDGIFFHREGKMGPPGQKNYTDGNGLAEKEAMAYERFKSLQGLDVPFCYGFFEFTVPSGQTVIGSVLEDLTGCTQPLMKHIKKLQYRYKSTIEYTDHVNPTYLQCLRTLNRLHQQRVAFTAYVNETSFFLLRDPSGTSIDPSETLTPPEIVLMGFSHARRAEDTHQWNQEGRDWARSDQSMVTLKLEGHFGSEFDQSGIWYGRYKKGRMLEDLTEF